MFALFKTVSALTLAAILGASSLALAQAPQPLRIRGQIEKVDGNVLTIKSRTGEQTVVTLTPDVKVMAFVPATLNDIKQDSYIGVAAMPEPDGSRSAISIHIFPEAMRGTGEGTRAWDVRPNSTMTNAAVASKVSGVDGQTLMVKFKDGEQKISVTPSTVIVAYADADKSELKAGTPVVILGATKKPDGSIETNRVNIGRGVVPAM